jgi:hypothetical protein
MTITNQINPAISRAENNTAHGIHKGDSTHHQDHVITPPNLSPMNNTAKREQNPIPPPPTVLLDSDITSSPLKKYLLIR